MGINKGEQEANHEVQHFGGIEDPQEVGKHRVLGIVDIAWCSGVMVTVGKNDGLDSHVRAQNNLKGSQR